MHIQEGAISDGLHHPHSKAQHGLPGFRGLKVLGGPGHLDIAGDKAQCQVVATSPEHQEWKDLPKKTMGHGRTLGSSSAR